MRFLKPVFLLSMLVLAGAGLRAAEQPKRVLACDMTALSPEQRTRHRQVSKRLLEHATRKELADGYLFTIDRAHTSVPELAEWVANESRCCPAVDFHLELPAFGPLTLRLDGGTDVKEFLATELGL